MLRNVKRLFWCTWTLFLMVGCASKPLPELSAQQAGEQIRSLLASPLLPAPCSPVAVVSEADSFVRPLKDLSAAELSRLDALSSAGLLRQETLSQSGRMYRRSTLSLLSSTLFWDGQALDFTRLCVSQLRLVGDVQVLNAQNHPELRVLRFHAVPNAWPQTWDATVPVPVPELARAVPYPQ